MVLLDVVLFDVVMQVPDAVLGIVLLVTLLASPMGGREVARHRGQVVVALTADVLHDALLVQLVGVPDVVLLHVGLFDVVTLASCCPPVRCKTHCSSTSWKFSTPGCS